VIPTKTVYVERKRSCHEHPSLLQERESPRDDGMIVVPPVTSAIVRTRRNDNTLSDGS